MNKNKKWKFQFAGSRILKTGIAVLVTALVCRLFGMTEAFAVITAIVTLEPTAASSIRKGAQRLPASVIGAGLAMGFAYFFGPSPFAYTLAAVFTIYACNKLNLKDGTLVATLTAVAMIPVSEGHYFYSFLERVGTTTIGLSVSTLVNLTILPPQFSTLIATRNEQLFGEAASVFQIRMDEILSAPKEKVNESRQLFGKLRKELEKSIQLSYYQKEEMRYHRNQSQEDKRFFTFEQRQLHLLERIAYHFNQLFILDADKDILTGAEKKIVMQVSQSIASILEGESFQIPDSHYKLIEELDELFWHKREEIDEPPSPKHHHRFSDDTILIFTILSIHDELENLEDLHHHEDELGEIF